MRRRGQLFSLDAMLAVVIVIIMLGTVTATSEGLRNEITSMVGWYERANIANNMLDVLTKSPGEPSNWVENPSEVRVIGLADNKSGGVSYQKMMGLVDAVENNIPAVKESLTRMCENKDFELLFFQGKWDFNVVYNWSGENTSARTGEYMPLNIPCTVELQGAQVINPPAPTNGYIGGIVECNPFEVLGAGALFFNYNYPLCFAGSVIAPEDNAGSIQITNTNVDSYVAIAGDLISDKRGSIQISVTQGSIYVGGSIIASTTGSTQLDAGKYIYVLGKTGKVPLVYVEGIGSNYIYAGYAMIFLINGEWYAVQGLSLGRGQYSLGKWYHLVNGRWIDVTSSVVLKNGEDIYVNGFNVIHVGEPGGGYIQVGSQGTLPTSIELPPCIAGSKPPLAVDNITSNYIFPTNVTGNASSGIVTNISPAFYKVIVKIGNNITVNPDMKKVIASRNNSPWVEVAERRTTLAIMNYSPKIVVSGDKIQRLLAGRLIAPLSYYTFMQVTVPNTTGYAIFIVRDGTTLKVLGVWRDANGNVGGALWVKTSSGIVLSKTYRGNGNNIWIPWADLFSYFNVENGRKIVELWAYKNTLGDVVITDLGGIGGFLVPKEEPFVIKLWVWDEP